MLHRIAHRLRLTAIRSRTTPLSPYLVIAAAMSDTAAAPPSHSPPSSPAPDAVKRQRTEQTKYPKHYQSQRQRSGKLSVKEKQQQVDPVLLHDILSVLGWSALPKSSRPLTEAEQYGPKRWPKSGPRDRGEVGAGNGWQFSEDVFDIISLTSHGDGLAVFPPENPQWVVIVPFGLPGDKVRAKVTRHGRFHSFAEPIERLESTSAETSFPIALVRDESLVGCKYFGTCAGCQYQSLPYSKQLELKQWVLQKAMKHFSGLSAEAIPEVKSTIPSPKQYHYRTKITPHFDIPKNGFKTQPADEEVPIGFEEKCRSRLIDIEECPIATETINAAMPSVRRKVKDSIQTYKRGATVLMRDSLVVEDGEAGDAKTQKEDEVTKATATEGTSEEEAMNAAADDTPEVTVALPSAGPIKGKGKAVLKLPAHVALKEPEEHACVTIHSETVTERVGKLIFQFPAGSFFQNNASILVPLTDFVREQIERDGAEESFLVDAYCGSGLFSLALASHFTRVCGIEIDQQSIAYASHNARVNEISNVEFHAGASEAIFDPIVKKLAWDGDKTTLIVDPPRKGCDAGFLKQVVEFKPRRIVYVSCNVHTMSANVGDLVRWSDEAYGGKGYRIKSLGAIDLFPQTHHTEGLLVLEREL